MSTEPARPPLVSLRAISKTFPNGTVALRDLSLDIAQGAFVSLVGPSGCGKSTALRIVAGLTAPSGGTMSLADVHGIDEASDNIGFVFQEPTLMPWAPIFDNVYLPLRLRGRSRDDARDAVSEALAGVGLDGFAQAFPRELSGGMKMRVSIARALVTRPRLLLMDEPFAALDEITRFKLNDDLLRLWRTLGCTVIFVTHSVFESVYLSDRIVIMAARPGRVYADIPIDASYPRDAQMRMSASYGEQCHRVSAALTDAMSAGGAA